jgi:dipeptidyl aminopeptidase/acylaminoacyl peptidase
MLFALLFAAALPLTIEDYATMPTISGTQLSPDRKYVAYVLNRADMERSVYDADIWLVDANGQRDVQLTRAKGADNHPRWSPDSKQIAFLSDRDGGRSAIWLAEVNGGEPERLTNEKGPISDFEWSPDGKTIAFVMREPAPTEREDVRVVGKDTRFAHVYLLALDSKTTTRLTQGSFDLSNVSWSPDGRLIAADRTPSGFPDFQKSDIVVISRSGEIRPLVARPGSDHNAQFSPDGTLVAFQSTGGRSDWLAEEQLYVVPATGGEPRLVSREYNRTPVRVDWSDDSKSLWFEGAHNTTSQIFRVNADGTGFRNITQFDGSISDLSVVGKTAAFVEQSLTAPPELYISSLDSYVPRQLTHHNDALRNRQLPETRVIRWKNPKDGLEIEGLLTLPLQYVTGQRYPLLTFAHGGPASRFDQAFLGYLGAVYAPNVLAGEGYVVLRPNPRGTGGYGESFRAANRNDWGGMDWVDINAGIDKLIADGIADPDRLGMMGWSYGGFMTAWAEGHSDRLKAISIGAPVVDLLSFHGTTDIRAFIPSYFRGKENAQAATHTDDETLMAIRRAPMSLDTLREHSPLWHLKPTTARILIQHGDADDRVPLSQGTMLYRTLQEMGVDVEMAIYPRSPHVPREPKQRLDVMRRNLEFFKSAIPTGAATAKSSSADRSPRRPRA